MSTEVPSNQTPSSAADAECSAFCDRPVAEEVRPPRGETQTEAEWVDDQPDYVFVPRWVVEKTGGGNAAILLARVVYWFSRKPDGYPRLRPSSNEGRRIWSPKYRGIREQTGLSKDKVRRALKSLISLGAVEVVADEPKWEEKSSASRRCLQIRLTEEYENELLSKGRLRTENEGGPGTRVQVADVRITETGNQAILLGSILPWFEPNKKGKSKLRIKREGHLWRANSHEQLAAETGLGCYQVKRALEGLSALLIKDYFAFAGKRTLHVRPNIEAVTHAWRQSTEKATQRGTRKSDR